MSKRLATTVLGALALLLAPALAQQVQAQSFYLSGGPVFSGGSSYDTGWTVSAGVKYGLPLLDITGGAGYTSLPSAKEGVEDASIWDVQAGAMVNLAVVGLGARAGYWFGDVSEFDVIPVAELRLWRFYAGVEYKGLLGDTSWTKTYVGLRL